ncbi:hypothetical protein CMI37_34785 [Candidatus Pacearchaeota archaeon]|nr:hypothetical protein [Candidatus Pacearchaeota archaeon]|tara:strand:- start:1277 stop:1756 length:480 start_codon:yes stop_codon:yes gene_type:complete
MGETGIQPADFKTALRGRFASLTAEQQEWLLLRRYFGSDKECNQYLNKTANWARYLKETHPDFRACNEMLLQGRPEDVDDVMIETLTKSNSLKSLIEERKVLDMGWDKISARMATVKGAAMKASIDRVKGSKHTVEHVYTVQEVLEVANVVEGEVLDVR